METMKEAINKLFRRKEKKAGPGVKINLHPDNSKFKKGTAPKTPEEVKAEEELKNLSPEDMEKMGRWYQNLGFKAEKAKNDIFAGAFNKALKLKNIDHKGTTGKLLIKLRDGFVRDAKIAVKKANDPSAFSDTKLGVYIKGQKRGINISAGKQKFASSVGAFSGNVLKYGRLIADATGLTVGAAHRIVMAAGMATARISEAGKEVRLENEDLINKTRIQDVDHAAEEAWNIYDKAFAKTNHREKPNTEALKNAYLMEMPKDLQKRLQNPSTANTFIQKIVQNVLQKELLGYEAGDHIIFEGSISRLNKNIEKLENNKKLTPEQRKLEIEKLITKQKKNLEDYDRMITQYGTIDGIAMALRYAQTAGKATVAVWQAETLVLSTEKLFEVISNLLTSHDIHPIDGAGKFIKNMFGEKNTGEEKPFKLETPEPSPQPTATQDVPQDAPILETPHEINPNEVIHQGQGIEHPLIKQIETNSKLAQELGFKGDITNKVALHKFAQGEAHRIAVKFGYVGENGQEVRITEANKMAIELKVQNGHPVVIEKTLDGKMTRTFKEEGQNYKFEKNEDNPYEKEVNIIQDKIVHSPETTAKPTLKHEAPKTLNEKPKLTPEDGLKTRLEEIKSKYPETTKLDLASIHEEEDKFSLNKYIEENTPQYKNLTEEEYKEIIERHSPDQFKEKNIFISQKPSAEELTKTISDQLDAKEPAGTVHTDSTLRTGSQITTGSGAQMGGQDEVYFRNINPLDQFKDISHEDNLILERHPEFAENPYNLSGKKLIEAYEASNKDLNFVFKDEPAGWSDKLPRISEISANKVLEYENNPSTDPTTNTLSTYLNVLREHAGIKPKSGIFGMGAESTKHYIARCLQTIAAGKGKHGANLEIFKEYREYLEK